MFKINAKVKRQNFPLFTFFSLVLAGLLCAAGTSNAIEGVWDPAKYIGIDEIKPGMKAYCLTCYSGTKIEKFDMDVISIIRNYEPGRDSILVQGTDERFIHTGPVWGCSGSPVYIEGRLAGALATAYTYSKDPLYGVTLIKDMLRVGDVGRPNASAAQHGYSLDFSRPIDFAQIDKQITTPHFRGKRSLAGAAALPCPLITSGLPARVTEQLNSLVEPFGLAVVSGVGGGAGVNKDLNVQLAPGSCLVVPLVTGDITMEAVGTATEVVGDKVYGFGHSFLGYGQVNLPMATGQVHTVVSSISRSIKLASAIKTVGALTRDESTAVFGRIGAKPHTFPLTITIDDYRDSGKQVYNCQVAHNKSLTPMLLRSTVSGAGMRFGELPPDHMIEYKVAIGVEGAEPITFENVSTDMGLIEMLMESISPVTMLMNNPYEKVDIKSVDFDIRIVPKSIVSHIWSVDLSGSTVKAGRNLDIEVVLESVLAGKKKYQCSFQIPRTLAPGRYELTICGGYGYEMFLRKAASYKLVAQDLDSLLEGLQYLLSIGRGKLYCILALPPGGVAIEKAELPDLPATKMLILQNPKRTLRIQPYPHWLEKSFDSGTVVIDRKILQITVEK
ncbi:MAG: SpoIVB peptidase S55 domain-containing protein [Sedimentisphaerales bacterium]